jgi:nuclear factor erythroid 2
MSKFEPLRRQSTAALAGLRHNHTYLNTDASDEAAGSSTSLAAELHPYSYKNKLKRMLKSQQQQNSSEMAAAARNQSRDEAILKANAIDLTLEEVVETSADDFNELIRVNEFSVEQINVLKDIRRRGKNKVAAQICRKRKLDSIDSLKEEVDELKEMKSVLISEYSEISNEVYMCGICPHQTTSLLTREYLGWLIFKSSRFY